MRWRRRKEHAAKCARCYASCSLEKIRLSQPSTEQLSPVLISKYSFSQLDHWVLEYYHLILSFCADKFTDLLISDVDPLLPFVLDLDDSKSFQKASHLLYHKHSSRGHPCWDFSHFQNKQKAAKAATPLKSEAPTKQSFLVLRGTNNGAVNFVRSTWNWLAILC